MSCLFCTLMENKSAYLYENAAWYVIPDKYPASPGHTLIILKTHKESFFELTDGELSEAKDALLNVKAILDKSHQPDAYNIAVNEGEAAGRTIHHAHIHLIPRYAGKGPKGGIETIFKGR